MEIVVLFVSFLIYFAIFTALWVLLMMFKKGKDWFFCSIFILLLRICVLVVGAVFGTCSVYILFYMSAKPMDVFISVMLTQICAIGCFSLACLTEDY